MLIRLVIRFVTLVFAILVVARYVPGISVEGFKGAAIAAVVLSLANLVIKPILFILTLPLTILTFGLFSFVLNAVILWLVAHMVEGFAVAGFFPALIGAFVISLISYVISKIAK